MQGSAAALGDGKVDYVVVCCAWLVGYCDIFLIIFFFICFLV